MTQRFSSQVARRRPGFTLVELLVVIAIIGILVALAVAGRTIRSRGGPAGHMHEQHEAGGLGPAQLYFGTKKRFPHGTYNLNFVHTTTPPPYNGKQNRRCWMHDTMAYFGESVLYDRFDHFMRTGSSFAYDFPECHTVIPTLMCPSDPANPKFITYTYSTIGVVGPPPSLDGMRSHPRVSRQLHRLREQ